MESELLKYQERIKEIYFEANKRRASNKAIAFKIIKSIKHDKNLINETKQHFTALFLQKMLLKSVENILRRVSRRMINKEDFISFWGWFFSFANLYEVDIFTTTVEKFPKVCYYCLSAPCVCIKYGKRANPKKRNYADFSLEEKERERQRVFETFFNSMSGEKQQYDFRYLGELIDTIYPNNRFSYKLSAHYEHSLKINEELNELIRACDAYMDSSEKVEKKVRFAEFKKEFADLTLWMISLWDNVFPDKNLDIEFKNYFINGCNVCNTTPCKCANVFDRSNYNIKAAGFLIEIADRIDFKDKKRAQLIIDQLKNAMKTLDEVEISHYGFELECIIRDNEDKVDLGKMRL